MSTGAALRLTPRHARLQAGLDQGATQGAPTAGGASPGVGGQAPAAASSAQGGANDPVLVIQSCPGCTFTVTRAMLEGSPRLDLERIYTALLQNIQSIAAQYREVRTPTSPSLSTPQSSASGNLPRAIRLFAFSCVNCLRLHESASLRFLRRVAGCPLARAHAGSAKSSSRPLLQLAASQPPPHAPSPAG